MVSFSGFFEVEIYSLTSTVFTYVLESGIDIECQKGAKKCLHITIYYLLNCIYILLATYQQTYMSSRWNPSKALIRKSISSSSVQKIHWIKQIFQCIMRLLRHKDRVCGFELPNKYTHPFSAPPEAPPSTSMDDIYIAFTFMPFSIFTFPKVLWSCFEYHQSHYNKKSIQTTLLFKNKVLT